MMATQSSIWCPVGFGAGTSALEAAPAAHGGRGVPKRDGVRVTTPMAEAALVVTGLAGGGFSAYAVTEDGTVLAWGDNLEGQLGHGAAGTASAVPAPVDGLPRSDAVAASANSAFALTYDGSVWAWGDDSQGELGNGKETYRSDFPVRVREIGGIVAITAGEYSAYALGRDGTVWAWGDNSDGQLGLPLSVGSNDVPVRVPGLSGVKQVAAGASSGYALRRDGTVWAWGDNAFGELAQSKGLPGSEVPLPVTRLPPVAAVAAGADAGYALLRDGTVRAWGDGSFGALGTGACPLRQPTNCAGTSRPAPVRYLMNVRAIAAGTYAAYALEADGAVWSWGYGVYGQLGDGSNESSDVPVPVNRLHHVVAIAAGGNAAYALEANGSVWAWGYGGYGQLGDGGANSSDVPVLVHGLAPRR
ncbi:MAG TPA: hypothetical protein VMF65_02155 [Acidimicrobiales bacterium]|nr:hypothetical protein [Acidimicrobiales bacterium]